MVFLDSYETFAEIKNFFFSKINNKAYDILIKKSCHFFKKKQFFFKYALWRVVHEKLKKTLA